tara:strand:+ start:931 stop:2937 length:2007 start_codon:yes stop_codon:yes gene_type:complete
MREIKRIAKFGFDNKSVFNLEDTPDDSDLPEDMGKNVDDTPLRQETKAEARQKVIDKLRAGKDANVSDVFSPTTTPKATTLHVKKETTTDFGFKDTKIIDTGQPLDTTSAKNLLSEYDARIQLAEEVLQYTDPDTKEKVLGTSDIGIDTGNVIGSEDITIESKDKWIAELDEATQAKADYIAEINRKSGWVGADDLIDLETEKKLRHQAFTTGVISDLNTDKPEDIAAMVNMKNTGEFTPEELRVAAGHGSVANEALELNTKGIPVQVGRDVRFALSTVEDHQSGWQPEKSSVARDMHVEQMGVGNFHETTLEERAAVSGVEAQYEWIEDPDTGKKKRTLIAPDLGGGGPKLGGMGGQDYKLSSKMAALVQGFGIPPGARTRSGMVYGQEKWTAEQPKFSIKDWEDAASQHFGGKRTQGYLSYMEAALTPSIDSGSVGLNVLDSPQMKELRTIHNTIINNAVYRNVIKKDILASAAGQPGYGHRTDWKHGIDSQKPKTDVTKKMTEAYFRGDFGESPIRNLHSAEVMGVSNLRGINVPLENPTQTYFDSHRSIYDDVVFSGALGSGDATKNARVAFAGAGLAEKPILQGDLSSGTVVPNPESSSNRLADGRNNTQFPRKEDVSSARDATIRRNILKFKGGHRFIPGAIALKGIIGLHKGSGGSGQFSK